MDEDIKKVAFFGGVAIVTSSVAALNEFTKLFDFAPLWSDLLISLGIFITAGYLVTQVRASHTVLVVKIPQGLLRYNLKVIGAYCIPLFVAILGVLTAIRPISNIAAGSWSACGSVSPELIPTSCEQAKCINLYDDRDRQVATECFRLDGSNYFQTGLQNRWHYFPKKMSVQCSSIKAASIEVPSGLVGNPKCDGRVQ
jgi:hypothetical protein